MQNLQARFTAFFSFDGVRLLTCLCAPNTKHHRHHREYKRFTDLSELFKVRLDVFNCRRCAESSDEHFLCSGDELQTSIV